MNKLTPRLQLLSDLVIGDSAADIGTDHGFLAMNLYRSGKCKKLIMTDVKPGPLEKCKGNLLKKGLSDEMTDIRLGDGLTPLKNGEVDSVVIAGMGGETIRDILAFDLDKTKSFKRIILQPRTHDDRLRLWLDSVNIKISEEYKVLEKGRECLVLVINN